MEKPSFAVGDLVKVTSGIYADAVGEVDDSQPECSTVRIRTREGFAYAYTDAVEKMPMASPKKAVLRKR